MRAEGFQWHEAWSAWVFPDGPRRRMSAHARYWALVDRAEFPHVDHTGEPVRWVTCPWCGCDLPMAQGDQ